MKTLRRFPANGVDLLSAIAYFKEHEVKANYALIDQSTSNLSDPVDVANTRGDQIEGPISVRMLSVFGTHSSLKSVLEFVAIVWMYLSSTPKFRKAAPYA